MAAHVCIGHYTPEQGHNRVCVSRQVWTTHTQLTWVAVRRKGYKHVVACSIPCGWGIPRSFYFSSKNPQMYTQTQTSFLSSRPKSNLLSRHLYFSLTVTQTSQISHPNPKSWLRAFFLLNWFKKFFFNLSRVDLQCCVNYWCTAKWFSYAYITLF